MRRFIISAIGLAAAGTALSKVEQCTYLAHAYAPTFESSTMDGEEAFADGTPDTIVARGDGLIDLDFGGGIIGFERDDQP